MNWDESGQCCKIKQSSDAVWQYSIALWQISSTNWVITMDCKVHYWMCRWWCSPGKCWTVNKATCSNIMHWICDACSGFSILDGMTFSEMLMSTFFHCQVTMSFRILARGSYGQEGRPNTPWAVIRVLEKTATAPGDYAPPGWERSLMTGAPLTWRCQKPEMLPSISLSGGCWLHSNGARWYWTGVLEDKK